MYHGSTFRFCFQVLLWHSLAFSCLQWLCFQGRGSKAFHKNIVFYKPSARDEWTDGVRKIKFLFSRPSVQGQLNKVYPEDLPDIVNKFGHGALVGLHVKQDGSKSQELQDVAAAAEKSSAAMAITHPNTGTSVGQPSTAPSDSQERPGPYSK